MGVSGTRAAQGGEMKPGGRENPNRGLRRQDCRSRFKHDLQIRDSSDCKEQVSFVDTLEAREGQSEERERIAIMDRRG